MNNLNFKDDNGFDTPKIDNNTDCYQEPQILLTDI